MQPIQFKNLKKRKSTVFSTNEECPQAEYTHGLPVDGFFIKNTIHWWIDWLNCGGENVGGASSAQIFHDSINSKHLIQGLAHNRCSMNSSVQLTTDGFLQVPCAWPGPWDTGCGSGDQGIHAHMWPGVPAFLIALLSACTFQGPHDHSINTQTGDAVFSHLQLGHPPSLTSSLAVLCLNLPEHTK